VVGSSGHWDRNGCSRSSGTSAGLARAAALPSTGVQVNVAELLKRASSQIGQSTVYRLGGGKTTGESPRDEASSCDCSAFVCWALALRKHQPEFAWLKKVNGGWYNTDGIWWDALKEPTGYFHEIKAPEPGALIVYPSRATSKVAGPKIGHVGVIADVKSGAVSSVIHCSSGNWKKTGDAIRRTAPAGVFDRSSAVRIAWCAFVD
jgi:cell wall-associated NlpC family hydrolase